jgi:23S rRNA pseudouridine1911/1915/1917 synthase
MSEPIELQVPSRARGMRLDRFLADELPHFSRSRLQALIREGHVTLNETGARSREILRTGDTIRLVEPPPEKIATEPQNIPLDVLFEDEDLLVINKPAGMVVHPGAGNTSRTLVNALLAHCRTLSGIGGKERPGIVHRLDKETSGCLVVAKNDATHQSLSRQFAERTVQKIYLALVAGTMRKAHGVIDADIGRHPKHRQRMAVTRQRGRSARTDYRVVRSRGGISLVECVLHTGRTHQIRVHLHHLGHPVLGDKVYGRTRANEFPRQMLHAWKLGFTHPGTGKRLDFEAPLPEDFSSYAS